MTDYSKDFPEAALEAAADYYSGLIDPKYASVKDAFRAKLLEGLRSEDLYRSQSHGYKRFVIDRHDIPHYMRNDDLEPVRGENPVVSTLRALGISDKTYPGFFTSPLATAAIHTTGAVTLHNDSTTSIFHAAEVPQKSLDDFTFASAKPIDIVQVYAKRIPDGANALRLLKSLEAIKYNPHGGWVIAEARDAQGDGHDLSGYINPSNMPYTPPNPALDTSRHLTKEELDACKGMAFSKTRVESCNIEPDAKAFMNPAHRADLLKLLDNEAVIGGLQTLGYSIEEVKQVIRDAPEPYPANLAVFFKTLCNEVLSFSPEVVAQFPVFSFGPEEQLIGFLKRHYGSGINGDDPDVTLTQDKKGLYHLSTTAEAATVDTPTLVHIGEDDILLSPGDTLLRQGTPGAYTYTALHPKELPPLEEAKWQGRAVGEKKNFGR